MAMHADQVADDSERWQNHDVDGRVAIEPKKVLERHRIAIVFRIENTNLHRPLRYQQQQGNSQNGCRKHLNDTRRVCRP